MEDALKNFPLFGSNTESDKAIEAYNAQAQKREMKLIFESLDNMPPRELKKFITGHSYDCEDCKGIGALRDRAKQVALEQLDLVEEEEQKARDLENTLRD